MLSRHATLLVALLAGLLLPLAGCGDDAPRYRVEEVAAPAGPGSGEPNLVRGDDGVVYLTWIEERDEGHVLRLSRWNGTAWDEPLPVAAGDDWFVNWADFPALCALADGTLAAHWLARTAPDTYAYGVRVALSGDGGRTWSEPVTPHRDGTPTEHGFLSFFARGPDAFGLIWLDGRETVAGGHGAPGDGEAAGHDEPGGGPMTLRAAVLDRNGRVSEEALLDARVCDCCGTDAATLPDGSVVAVYRDRSGDEVRDISVLRGEPAAGGGLRWSDPRPVHEDGWRIEGCPVNGPALALAGGRAAVAWFTAGSDDRGRVRVAFSRDGGATFGPPVEAGDGRPLGRVDLEPAEDDESVLVVWLESVEGGDAEIRLRRVRDGDASAPSQVLARIPGSRASGFPRLVRADEGWLLAWTDAAGERARVRTARIR